MPHNTQLQRTGELSKHFKACSRISPLWVLLDMGRRSEKGGEQEPLQVEGGLSCHCLELGSSRFPLFPEWVGLFWLLLDFYPRPNF